MQNKDVTKIQRLDLCSILSDSLHFATGLRQTLLGIGVLTFQEKADIGGERHASSSAGLDGQGGMVLGRCSRKMWFLPFSLLGKLSAAIVLVSAVEEAWELSSSVGRVSTERPGW